MGDNAQSGSLVNSFISPIQCFGFRSKKYVITISIINVPERCFKRSLKGLFSAKPSFSCIGLLETSLALIQLLS